MHMLSKSYRGAAERETRQLLDFWLSSAVSLLLSSHAPEAVWRMDEVDLDAAAVAHGRAMTGGDSATTRTNPQNLFLPRRNRG